METWSTRDRGLAEGLLYLEDSTGPHGQPMRLALDPDNDGWFEVEAKTDHAQAALDRWREEQQRGGKPEAGSYGVVTFTRPAGDASRP